MKISRHNYEEYFILYLDNELSSEDRREVELFVQDNPDLKTELDLLQQSQLIPDTSIVFSDKEELMRVSGADTIINTANYEEWLICYVDNELTPAQKIAVEEFVAAHPAIQLQLDILQKTKLQPETIIFPDKESLYRKEEKVRVVAIHWRRIAVAAALLLAVSSTALIVINNKKDKETGVAEIKPGEKKNMPGNAIDQPANVKKQANENNELANNDLIKKNTDPHNSVVAIKEKKTERKEKTKQQLPVEVKQNDAVVAKTKEEKRKTNDLPQPVYNPNVNKELNQTSIAQVETPVKESLTNSKETNQPYIVTPNSSHPLDNVIAASSKESVDPIDDEQPGKKNKLRGFFRKVTRTFEKTTNIKATDEDRLLVGGLAIKL
ncbi:anti-sigma factor family protein [Terrimonas alba]|uniref:anti-sigma factor family protein n=1 Tax=Terrimonas alba TaxID=3349636 RepID=UPI0035F2846E